MASTLANVLQQLGEQPQAAKQSACQISQCLAVKCQQQSSRLGTYLPARHHTGPAENAANTNARTAGFDMALPPGQQQQPERHGRRQRATQVVKHFRVDGARHSVWVVA
jgi:hypothetical protein